MEGIYIKKHVLREMGLTFADKTANAPKKFIITVSCLVLITAMILGSFSAVIKTVRFFFPPQEPGVNTMDTNIDEGMMPFYWIELLVAFLLYFILKSVLTSVFCSDVENSIAIKFLQGGILPICLCREGLKIWQTVLIYCVPAFSVYIPMFIICVVREGEWGALTMLFIMIPFMAFDLLLAGYVLVLKAKDRISYIAVNNHIYNLTVYK